MTRVRCFWVEKDGESWVRRDTGERAPFPSAFGFGAIFDADPVFRDAERERGGADRGDGHFPVVVTPGGEWVIDGCAYSNGEVRPCPWTRTGDPTRPETFTVHPSINFPGRFHGWLQAGWLFDA